MRIPSALTADLALLTDALDVSSVDVASTVSLLMSDVAAAVSSYAGLSLRLHRPVGDVELTTLDDVEVIARIVTSLRLPVTPTTAGPAVVIVLYATRLGAFVDLAADLAWLTDRTLGDVSLDEDLGVRLHAHPVTSLRSLSSIDQAIGVLVGRGHTPEEALVELEALAARDGNDRRAAALVILATLPSTVADATE